MNNINRIFVILLLFCSALTIHAQSGDKLFMEGQRLQQVMTVASQNAAIKKFQAAKVVYTTADKKKMCDNQITICNRNISSLRGGGKSRSGKKRTTQDEEKVKLKLSQNNVVFDGDQSGQTSIKVDASSTDWTFSTPSGVNGTDNFVVASRSNDAQSINIYVGANPQTLSREQIINVDLGDNRETITVHQKGKPVVISADKSLMEYSLKGGSKSIELYTNSDSIIAENNNLTWHIESKPDWVETDVEVKKKKGIFGAGFSALKGIISGTASDADKAGIKVSNVKIIVAPVAKGGQGRKGEIVFASQDKRYKIVIMQQ